MDAQQHRPVSRTVYFLHERLAKRRRDRYLINLARAYHQLGFRVTFYTSSYNRAEDLDDTKFLDRVKIKHSGWWIPKSLFGLCRRPFAVLRSICMACKVILNPPKETSVIVLDISTVALYLLHLFTRHKLFYVESFEEIPDVCEHTVYSPSLLEAKFIKLADEILVETAMFADLLKKSFPALGKEPTVLYPAVDVGLWDSQVIQIERIIPDLLENTILFLSVGKFNRSSNFRLALDAFELLLQMLDDSQVTKRFQLVIAGNCRTLNEKLYYNEMVALAKDRLCASQVSILKQLPVVHEKTLLTESAVVIHPSKADMQADFLLKAMSLGKPIVATNKGIAPRILQNKFTGIMTEPDPTAMAQVLKKLMRSPHLQSFLGELARDGFQKNYSYQRFCDRVVELMMPKATALKYTKSEKSLINDGVNKSN
ncbi:uncharacterized protein LOC126747297 [Anthonomus grandis grandis]|uniref:uncharacterized protein LOC126747297 n=1 Tax=Anthonomus grandis grandis TaxID=2921223 RepID=UPI002165844A|nr:uncharacterized protein LOC126747297 [Anthonomus grandis grandis]